MLRTVLAGALIASPAIAGDMLFPVDCTLGENCFIQQYVDRNPGPGVADFTCGPMTYDGHRGTDIRLPDEAAMRRGVDVLAATPGVVRQIRDGMADRTYDASRAEAINGKDCGNAVVVERADGWRFLYCHLKRGSVAVRTGDRVAAGEVLGQIGLSGRTQFPHLHLTVMDQARRIMDPFDARQQNEACSLKDRRSLWRDLTAQDYQPGGPLTAGFSASVPKYDAIKAGRAHQSGFETDAPALVFWAHFFGLRAGDELHLLLTGPDGEVVATDIKQMTKNRARQFSAVGRRVRGTWAPGTYTGVAELVRGGAPVDTITARAEVH
ncbi:MAG: M23 family metallopeptidase [Pseudomonadota bacterium]